MLKELVSYLLNRYALVLYAVGLTFLALASVFSSGFSVSVRAPLLLESLGYAVVGGTLVASVMNFAFESATKRAFTIVAEAEAAKIREIFAKREHSLKPIREAIERAKSQIDILTVAGTSTLHSHAEGIITTLHGRCLGDRGVPARVLLLDPRSRFAFERCLREEQVEFPPKDLSSFNYHRQKLCGDTVHSIRQLESALSGDAGSSIRARLCNAAPMVMYVRADDALFVEQYHYGIPTDQMTNPFTKCLGKAVPVLRFDASSEMGAILRSHFDYMWNRSEHRDVQAGTAEYIQHQLETENWVQIYSRESELEDRRLDIPNDAVARARCSSDP